MIRDFRPGDEAATYDICLKTGDHGKNGERFYQEDPDALGRIYVGPYLKFEPELALILTDHEGIAGYALAAFDSRAFFARYEREWRPALCARFPDPSGPPESWSRVEAVYHLYHHPDYFCPEPYACYPSHLHIDLLERVQGRGWGRRMINELLARLRQRGSAGVHLGMSALNHPAYEFYRALGFTELCRQGTGDSAGIYLGMRLDKGGSGRDDSRA